MADSPALNRLCEESQATTLLALSWTLFTLSTIVLGLRLYFRLSTRSGLGSDDYTIFASWASSLVYSLTDVLMRNQVIGAVDAGFLTKWVLSGLGSHLQCLSATQSFDVLKWSQLTQIVDVVGIGLVKISVCLCVLRVLERAAKNLARCIWVLLAFIVASHVTQLILFLTQCRPMDAIWIPQVHSQCFSLHITYLAGYIRFGKWFLRTIYNSF